MYKKTVLPVLVCGLLVLTPVASAKAATAADALARMDQILKEMQSLRAEFVALLGSAGVSAPAVPQVQGASTSAILTDDLSYGATNESIRRIQKLLATDSEIYADGTVSGFFGPKTQDAIRRFQARFGLDTVGVVGPSTKAILEAFMAAYPTENYPAGVLTKAVPQVQGASTSVPSTPIPTSTPSPVTSSARTFKSIEVEEDDGEFTVRSVYQDGSRFGAFALEAEDEDDLVAQIAKKLGVAKSEVVTLVDTDELDFDSANGDEEDAADALDDAKDALSDAKDEIDAAEEDGDDVDDALELYDEARDSYKDARAAYKEEEYEDAVDLAEDAVKTAKKAVKAID